jgi:hypothetical protein
MSKWRKALKNKRRFDARYFLNERVEVQETVENSVQQEEVKRNFHDFSFDSWLTEAEEPVEESHCGSHKRDDEELEENMGDMYDPRQGYSPEDDIADRRKSQRKKDNKELEETAKPDFLDLDKDGDKEESMADTAKDKDDVKEG